MAYLTSQRMVKDYGADEIRRLVSPDTSKLVDAALLVAVVNDDDLSGWSDAEVDNAMEAVARLEGHIMDAERIVDGYIAKSYTLPVPANGELRRATAALLRWTLYAERRPQAVIDDHSFWVDWLKSVAAGRVLLDGAGDETTAAKKTGGISVKAPAEIFTAEVLGKMP